MCDNLNTTFAIEAECRFCETPADCGLFRNSFIHRCAYYTIPDRFDQWGYADGFCTDGLDLLSVSLAPWVMIIGWALLMFGVGLLRKERGEYAALRRYGVQVNADVLERTTAESVLKTEASMPDVKITRFYVRATWIIDPKKLGIGNKYFRWVAIRRLVGRWCRQHRGQPAKVSADGSGKYPSRLPTKFDSSKSPCAVLLRNTCGKDIGYTHLACAAVGVLLKRGAGGCGVSHEQEPPWLHRPATAMRTRF